MQTFTYEKTKRCIRTNDDQTYERTITSDAQTQPTTSDAKTQTHQDENQNEHVSSTILPDVLIILEEKTT